MRLVIMSAVAALALGACNGDGEKADGGGPQSQGEAAADESSAETDDMAGDMDGGDEVIDPGEGEGISIEEMRERAMAEIDVEACENAGGVVRPEGMLGMPRCVMPYADAGEQCRDSSECEGQCRATDGVTDYDAAPGSMVGACQANDSPFGCYAEIEDGSLGAALCVD